MSGATWAQQAPAGPPPGGWMQGATSFPAQPTVPRAGAGWAPDMTYAEYLAYVQAMALANANAAGAQPTPNGQQGAAPSPEQRQQALAAAAAQYFTNGAEATSVPTQGPGAAYYSNGAEATAIPTSTIPTNAPSPSPSASATAALPSGQGEQALAPSGSSASAFSSNTPSAPDEPSGTTTLTAANVATNDDTSLPPANAPPSALPGVTGVPPRVEVPVRVAMTAERIEDHPSAGYWIGIAVAASALMVGIATAVALLVWLRKTPA